MEFLSLIAHNHKGKLRLTQGYTLPELLVVFIIMGILAAVASPGIIGILNQGRLKDASQDLESALRLAQGNALKYASGIGCTVTINNTSPVTIGNSQYYTVTANSITDDRGTATTTDDIQRNCILQTINILKTRNGDSVLELKTSGTGTIIYNFKGEIPVASNQTIVLYDVKTKQSKCIVLSSPLALIRSGEYTNTTAMLSAGQTNNTSIAASDACINVENRRYDNNNY